MSILRLPTALEVKVALKPLWKLCYTRVMNGLYTYSMFVYTLSSSAVKADTHNYTHTNNNTHSYTRSCLLITEKRVLKGC